MSEMMIAQKRPVVNADVIEQVITVGDLSKLSPAQRVAYYTALCKSLNLNPLTKPFEYIVLNGRLTLYARKDCTDQLRKANGVSIDKPEIVFADDLVTVTVVARDKDGRTDADLGVVSLAGLKGTDRANAIMKAITKAKRRVTLSLCGLGFADESEVEDIPDAKVVTVNMETGEIEEPAPASSPNGAQTERHWIDDDMTRKKFFGWAYDQGLSDKEIYEALGVERIHDFKGTKLEAMRRIQSYVAQQACLNGTKEA